MTEAFVIDAVRTPIGRYGGSLASVRPDDLAARTITAMMERQPSLPTDSVDEVILGCANQAGEDNRNVARMALLLAGLPETVPGVTVNRLCGSGLEAIVQAARAVRLGDCDIVLAGGVESMSRAPFVVPKAMSAFERSQAEMHDTTIGWRFINEAIADRYGVDSMPQTGENVAEAYQVRREDQDAFALASQQKAAAAMAAGRLAEEIVPVAIPQRRGGETIVATDEHLRPDTTLEALAKLPTPFRAGGTVTAGNASGVNDGAAIVLIASARACKTHALTPIARVTGTACVGVAPRVMGIGPLPAVRKLMQRTGTTIDGYDVIELNEAFASQALAVTRGLGLTDDDPRVNPNGGAIALGHPLGMSGARIFAAAVREGRRRNGMRVLATMCMGVGQGLAVSAELTP